MANGNDDDLDLGLTLGYSCSCIRTRLNNNSGAGVNAGPSVDMTFAASDPLSELVWSPHKGLSLRCARCSKADKKPFLLWNVGPSNMVPSPSQSIRFQGTDEEKIVEGSSILSNPTLNVDNEICPRTSLVQSTSNSATPVIETSHGQKIDCKDKSEGNNADEGVLHKNNAQNEERYVDDEEKVHSPRVVQMPDVTDGSQRNTGPSNQNSFVQGNRNSGPDIAISDSLIPAADTRATEVHPEIQSRAKIDMLPEFPRQDDTMNDAILATEEENKRMTNMHSFKLPFLGDLECTAENDLHDLSKEANWQPEEKLPRSSSVQVGTSTINSNLRGKNKAISDGKFSIGSLNGEDDSHESVESCNSAGLLSNGKRLLKCEDNLVFESKRLKQVDGSPASMSMVRNDSSFMNWIANMVKGFSKSNEEDPSHPCALAHANQEHANLLHQTVICSEHHETMSRNMGFQTIFQSLYSQSTKLVEAKVSKDDRSLESRDLLQTDKTNLVNFPISCPRQNGMSCQNFMSSDKSIPSTTDAGFYSGQQYMFPMTVPVKEDSVAELAENKDSVDRKCHGDRDGVNSSEVLGLNMISKVDNENPDLVSEGRPVNEISNKSKQFGSLWITRFAPKTGSNTDPSKQISSCFEAMENPDQKVVNSQIQKNPDFTLKQKLSEVKDSSNENSGGFLVRELQVFAGNTQCSVGFGEIQGHNQQNSGIKPNPMLPSQPVNRSEAIASVFARRLDALKHINPSGSENGAIRSAATCFYCGKSGHSLGDCSEITETELDLLLRNISSYVGVECPRLCIRCFQLDHWAAACPRGSLSRQQGVEKSSCFSVRDLKLLPIYERNSQFLEKEENDKGALHKKSCSNIDIRNLGLNGGQRSSSSNETQKRLASNSRDNSSGEIPHLHLSNLVSTHFINIPQGIVDAVRRLQVSRTDILRLMRSHVLMPHLEGFFLRLRLGNWEEGLGGTGYHVACIIGQAGKAAKDLKKSIFVNVGGIKCQVASQYVSNQDFLEDEFMGWWCRTLRSGGKLPTKDDLESKLKQRINLGF